MASWCHSVSLGGQEGVTGLSMVSSMCKQGVTGMSLMCHLNVTGALHVVTWVLLRCLRMSLGIIKVSTGCQFCFSWDITGISLGCYLYVNEASPIYSRMSEMLFGIAGAPKSRQSGQFGVIGVLGIPRNVTLLSLESKYISPAFAMTDRNMVHNIVTK